MQFDSDREIASENEAETNSDCATASEQSDKIDSDTTEQLTDSDVDPEYTIFPISFAKTDEACVRLNDLIQSAKIPKHKILYRHVFDKISTKFRGIFRVLVNFAAPRPREKSEALS